MNEKSTKAKKRYIYITDKGLAYIAAKESGLIPDSDDGGDDRVFEEFWSNYQKMLDKRRNPRLKWDLKNCLIPALVALILTLCGAILQQ